MTAGLPLMKTVFTPLAKIVLIPLGLTAADKAILKKIYGSGRPSDLAPQTTALIILILDDIIKIVEESLRIWFPDKRC